MRKTVIISNTGKRFSAATVGFPANYVRKTAAGAQRDAEKIAARHLADKHTVTIMYFADGELRSVEELS